MLQVSLEGVQTKVASEYYGGEEIVSVTVHMCLLTWYSHFNLLFPAQLKFKKPRKNKRLKKQALKVCQF